MEKYTYLHYYEKTNKTCSLLLTETRIFVTNVTSFTFLCFASGG